MKKSKHFEKESEELKSIGRGSRWYTILNKMLDAESPKSWSISQLEPDTPPEVLADKLSLHFSSITNEASSLTEEEIPPSSNPPGFLLPQLLESTVATKLQGYKIPNSTVPGDIPKHLVKLLYKELAVPLTLIYNSCLAHTKWPRIWKSEVVVPIPKIPTPTGYNNLRPISMSPLWSKLLETIVAEITINETGKNWKENQHGGVKGSSIDHVLVEAWDKILKSLDRSQSHKAVVFTALDFSKSFSRCSHQQILRSYAGVGASRWLLLMHAAFLKDRSMSVKLGNIMSKSREVTGGAVQGSVLGVLDHNVCLNDLDEELTEDNPYIAKYVDDLTIIDTVDNDTRTEVDNTDKKPLHTIYPQKTQEAFDKIKKRTEEKNL